MVSGIRIYIEGDKRLRPGFSKVFDELRDPCKSGPFPGFRETRAEAETIIMRKGRALASSGLTRMEWVLDRRPRPALPAAPNKAKETWLTGKTATPRTAAPNEANPNGPRVRSRGPAASAPNEANRSFDRPRDPYHGLRVRNESVARLQPLDRA